MKKFIKSNMDETRKASNRLLSMGYGIIAFMDTHLWLILMMLTIIAIQIPFMH